MKILVSGYNGWSDIEAIKEALEIYRPANPILCYYIQPFGGLVVKTAQQLGLETELLKEDDIEGIDLLLAFHPYIRKSKSTKALIKLVSNAGKPYHTFGSHF